MTRRLPTRSRCGSNLDECRCRYTGPVTLDPAEMKARHRESVKRAKRSGWPVRTLAEVRAGHALLEHMPRRSA